MTIHRGFLAVDKTLLAWALRTSESKPSTRMSASGKAWHYEIGEDRQGEAFTRVPFLRAVVDLTGEGAPPSLVRWWANVLRAGAEYSPHKHDGKWAFVYHLTEGSAVRFEGGPSFEATPGQILVFDSKLLHWTDAVTGDAPRVSIAGNLHFKSVPRVEHGA